MMNYSSSLLLLFLAVTVVAGVSSTQDRHLQQQEEPPSSSTTTSGGVENDDTRTSTTPYYYHDREDHQPFELFYLPNDNHNNRIIAVMYKEPDFYDGIGVHVPCTEFLDNNRTLHCALNNESFDFNLKIHIEDNNYDEQGRPIILYTRTDDNVRKIKDFPITVQEEEEGAAGAAATVEEEKTTTTTTTVEDETSTTESQSETQPNDSNVQENEREEQQVVVVEEGTEVVADEDKVEVVDGGQTTAAASVKEEDDVDDDTPYYYHDQEDHQPFELFYLNDNRIIAVMYNEPNMYNGIGTHIPCSEFLDDNRTLHCFLGNQMYDFKLKIHIEENNLDEDGRPIILYTRTDDNVRRIKNFPTAVSDSQQPQPQNNESNPLQEDVQPQVDSNQDDSNQDDSNPEESVPQNDSNQEEEEQPQEEEEEEEAAKDEGAAAEEEEDDDTVVMKEGHSHFNLKKCILMHRGLCLALVIFCILVIGLVSAHLILKHRRRRLSSRRRYHKSNDPEGQFGFKFPIPADDKTEVVDFYFGSMESEEFKDLDEIDLSV